MKLEYYEISVPQNIIDKSIDGIGDVSYMIDMSKYKHLLKRGDVIGVLNYPGYGYRNDGKVMWDGERLVDLEYEIDEYGSVPPIFIVGKEFDSALYWQQDSIYQCTFTQPNMVIDHNNYIYASFDKALVSNVSYRTDESCTFDYQRSEILETWTVLTSDINRYFKDEPILSMNCLHLDYFTEENIVLPDNYKTRYFLYDVDIHYTIKPTKYKKTNEMIEPILVRHVTSDKPSSQDVMKTEFTNNRDTEYTFVDYNSLSTWTWKLNDNVYTITLTDNSIDKSDAQKFQNLEIATVGDVSTYGNCPPKNMYYYIWDNDREPDFLITFQNSMKFLVKKYGLIYIDQIITC